jgi:hypothetical protein
LAVGQNVAIKIGDLQLWEDHWVLADLIGKGGHLRTVPVPEWVKSVIDVLGHLAEPSNRHPVALRD